MAICSTNCAYNPPNPVGTNCKIDLRPGGLGRLILFACDIQFTDIMDLNEWCTYKREGKIVISPKILGQKIENEYTEKLVNSCDPEIVTGMKQTIEWKDYNADDEFFTDFDFYNIWSANRTFYNVGFVTCDGLFYGIIENYSLKLSHIIEENYNDSSYWMGSMSFNNLYELKPVLIYNLVDTLLNNCENIGYYGGSVVNPVNPCNGNILYWPGDEIIIPFFPIDRNLTDNVTSTFRFYADPCCDAEVISMETTEPGFTITPATFPMTIGPNGATGTAITVTVDLNTIANGIYNVPFFLKADPQAHCTGELGLVALIEVTG